jgi:outer membrane PBP1 activator LpoA protein
MQGTLLAWLAATHANPQLGPVGREQVRLSYGQICLETDRYAQGLAWVRSAYEESGQAVYRLMEANFLMLQGELDAAAQLLAQIARMPRLTATDREHIAVLNEAIAARRMASPSPRKGQG